jgi:hypothetical protein
LLALISHYPADSPLGKTGLPEKQPISPAAPHDYHQFQADAKAMALNSLENLNPVPMKQQQLLSDAAADTLNRPSQIQTTYRRKRSLAPVST